MTVRFGYERELLRPTVLEIDLDAIEHNIREVQRCVGPLVKMFAVLKCNAYGFGTKEVGQIVQESDAFGIAVADLTEAVYLRQNGVTKPILVYANNLPSVAGEFVRFDLMPTIDDLGSAETYARAARGELEVFVKIDVGLHRNGVPAEQAKTFFGSLARFRNLRVEGIYAHLDVPDPSGDEEYVRWQFGRFQTAVEQLEESGARVPIKMVASSPIVSQYPEMYLNAVDPGKLLYGIYCPKRPKQSLRLKAALKGLKTRIIARKRIVGGPFDTRLDFAVKDGLTIGVIPLGWGDGLPARLDGEAVLVKGRRVRMLGGLHVEHARIDLSGVPEAEIGDEVVVIGRQGEDEITPDEAAEAWGIGGSALTRAVREHVGRLFYRHGKPLKLKTMLGETFPGAA